MAQQDLVQKTRFEKQIPFPILDEIAKAVKARQNYESLCTESSSELLAEISDQANELFRDDENGIPVPIIRTDAIELIAKLIHFIKINTPK